MYQTKCIRRKYTASSYTQGQDGFGEKIMCYLASYTKNGPTPAILKEFSFPKTGIKSTKRKIMNQNKSAHLQETTQR